MYRRSFALMRAVLATFRFPSFGLESVTAQNFVLSSQSYIMFLGRLKKSWYGGQGVRVLHVA